MTLIFQSPLVNAGRARIGSVVSFDLVERFSRVSQSPACETALWLTNAATTFQPILVQPEWQFKPTTGQQKNGAATQSNVQRRR